MTEEDVLALVWKCDAVGFLDFKGFVHKEEGKGHINIQTGSSEKHPGVWAQDGIVTFVGDDGCEEELALIGEDEVGNPILRHVFVDLSNIAPVALPVPEVVLTGWNDNPFEDHVGAL
jgi:hypothetical protein